MSPPSLFDALQEPRPLARKLNSLAEKKIFLGTSSWKYEGWLGQIYSPERYFTRGKFSQKRFEEQCLEEYAETFPIVCGDFSFYQFPSPEFWSKLFATAPHRLQFAFKVPEEITVKRFPTHARYGRRAGADNPNFLDAALFAELFLEPLRPYGQRTQLVIFEFSPMAKSVMPDAYAFLSQLEAFLEALPRGGENPRYAVEIRNVDFLCPEYFALLKEYGVAHVFNAWTRMPELGEQMALPEAFTTNFVVSRALLRKGRPYEQAVQAFQPYQRVQDPNPAARDALRDLIRRQLGNQQTAFIFVNNRLEGNAPQTIEAVIDEFTD